MSERVAGPGRDAVAAVWRIEAARVVGTLARSTRDFALAEDLAQEALAEALVSWPRDGVPRNPAGWLVTVGRRRAIDAFRRRAGQDERYATLARELDVSPGGDPDADLLFDPDRIDDDLLALMFVACHPVLSREASIALTLRVVGGLTSDEIARAFLIPTATVQARITRAKKTLAATRVPFAVPPAPERGERLGAVLGVLYLIFTEGSSATSGADWIRPDLAYEAVRLARGLARLMPDEPEVLGLLALFELTAARFPARVRDGAPVPLEEQDRRVWDRAAIRRGRAALARAGGLGRGLGAYGLQAAIAASHAAAPSVPQTDWAGIVLLYDALAWIAPSPVVALNRAVAVAMADGPAAGLALVDTLAGDGLADSHLLPTVRGELLSRLGRVAEARTEFATAYERCRNEAERALLRRKLGGLAEVGRPLPMTSDRLPGLKVKDQRGGGRDMGKVTAQLAMSLDGFIANPEDGIEELFGFYFSGDVGVKLSEGFPELKVSQVTADLLWGSTARTGATIVGRRLYDITNGWNGHPGGEVPMVVLTHNPPTDWPRDGVPIHFVSDVEAAVAKAQELAGGKDVSIAGPTVTREVLDAGLLDEFTVSLVPVILGAGIPWFAGSQGPVRLSDPVVHEDRGVTHLTFRVERSDR